MKKNEKSNIKLSRNSLNDAAELLSKLSLRERIAQLIIADVKMYDIKQSRVAIEHLVEVNKVGGLIFYKGTCEDQIKLYNLAVSHTNIPLFVAIDGEWGLAMRLKKTMRFPINMALGAIADEKKYLLREYGRMMGAHCLRMGININFAPVLDVNSNPQNPVIGARSYGEWAQNVSNKGIAYSLGLEDAGVISVAKHFPGHGDTLEDSHKSLPTVSREMSELINVDLLPFSDYIKSGCNGIMTAHLNVPAIDSETGFCTSLSPIVIQNLLRDKMNFNGLVFTDALVMKGVSNNDKIAVKALKAGNDILVMPENVDNTIDEIEQAIHEGELSENDINVHCLKILAYKNALKLENKQVSPQSLYEDLHSKDAISLCKSLWKEAITIISDAKRVVGKILPEKCRLISLGEDENGTYVSLGDTKVDTRQFIKYVHPKITEIITLDSMSDITKACIIDDNIPTIVEVFSDKQRYVEVVSSVSQNDNVIIIFYLNPYKLSKFSICGNSTVICAYEDSEYAQEMTQRGIFGEFEFHGKLPINI